MLLCSIFFNSSSFSSRVSTSNMKDSSQSWVHIKAFVVIRVKELLKGTITLLDLLKVHSEATDVIGIPSISHVISASPHTISVKFHFPPIEDNKIRITQLHMILQILIRIIKCIYTLNFHQISIKLSFILIRNLLISLTTLHIRQCSIRHITTKCFILLLVLII